MFVLVIFVTFTITKYLNAESENEYCQFETFNPKCSSSQIILMKKALFGRMSKGRCITEDEIKSFGSLIHDQKYFGCSVDALFLFHEKCSFRQECVVKVSDPMLKRKNPCSPGLILHLESEYTCVPVYQVDDNKCLLTATDKSKYLPAKYLNANHCGKNNSPWVIEAAKGQKILISYITTKTSKIDDKYICDEVGIVLQDINNRSNASLCSSTWLNREEFSTEIIVPSYKSSSNIVRMFLNNGGFADENFALNIQAEGCLDIIPPEDTWLKRNNDDIVIGCYSSKQTWYLRCENGQWVGSAGNCSIHDQPGIKEKLEDDKLSRKALMPKNQQILAIVSICGMGVIVCSMIICIGAVCARKYNLNNKTQSKLNCQNLLPYDPSYSQHTYNPEYQVDNHLCMDGTVKKNGRLNGEAAENDQTYFVLEEDKKDVV